MRREPYFVEDLRWPSKSQRFGWLVAVSIGIFIAFQLNLHLTAPLIAIPLLVVLVLLLLAVLTLQQRLTVRIELDDDGHGGVPLVGRLRRRTVEEDRGQVPLPALKITYVLKSPVSALAPGRRGSRLGRRRQVIPLTDVERWSASKISRTALLRRNDAIFPIGLQREAVTIHTSNGQHLIIPTRLQPEFLQALALSRVDAERNLRAIVRDEI